MQKSNLCNKCNNKVACALEDNGGVAKHVIENMKKLTFYNTIDTNCDNKVIAVVRDDDRVLVKETLIFDSIEKGIENIIILSRAVPYIQFRCVKYLATKKLRKEGVRIQQVVNKRKGELVT